MDEKIPKLAAEAFLKNLTAIGRHFSRWEYSEELSKDEFFEEIKNKCGLSPGDKFTETSPDDGYSTLKLENGWAIEIGFFNKDQVNICCSFAGAGHDTPTGGAGCLYFKRDKEGECYLARVEHVFGDGLWDGDVDTPAEMNYSKTSPHHLIGVTRWVGNVAHGRGGAAACEGYEEKEPGKLVYMGWTNEVGKLHRDEEEGPARIIWDNGKIVKYGYYSNGRIRLKTNSSKTPGGGKEKSMYTVSDPPDKEDLVVIARHPYPERVTEKGIPMDYYAQVNNAVKGETKEQQTGVGPLRRGKGCGPKADSGVILRGAPNNDKTQRASL